MLLTVSLFNKGSFLSSLINKCRQVARINDNNIKINLKPNISNSPNITTLKSSTAIVNVDEFNNRPAAANISLSSGPVANASKSLEEQVGLPLRPKKPLTPFFRFLKDMRPKIAAANPKLPLTEIVREASKKWEAAGDSLKQRLQDEYKRESQQYLEIRAKYDANITDEQRVQLKELKQEITEAKERRMMRKRIKDLGRPKKPSSAFLRYVSIERARAPPTTKQTFREWQQQVTLRWSQLPQEEKDVHLQEARKELEKYKKEISLWEEKMIRSGNIDVIRHNNLIDPPEPKPRKR